jgi:hypothetical protein
MSNATGIETAALAEELEIDRSAARGWFTRLVTWHLQRRRTSPRAVARKHESTSDHARALIRAACVKSAVSGALAGSFSTAAALVTAQTQGTLGAIAVPLAGGAIGLEMAFRSLVQVDLACDLARAFDVPFHFDDPDDLWRLYAVVFGAADGGDDDEDPGRDMIKEVMSLEGEDVGEKIGKRILGESVARNVLPVVGIVTSAVTNYLVTRKLGDTLRRYMRYQRALRDALEEEARPCLQYLDLLVEGVWFLFAADGKLTPEEIVTLAHLLDRLPPQDRAAVQARFVEDELEWADRIEVLPEPVRDHFLHALEVAAAVDKKVGLPERKILRRAAHHLGRAFDKARIDAMIERFETHGVLNGAQKKVTTE